MKPSTRQADLACGRTAAPALAPPRPPARCRRRRRRRRRRGRPAPRRRRRGRRRGRPGRGRRRGGYRLTPHVLRYYETTQGLTGARRRGEESMLLTRKSSGRAQRAGRRRWSRAWRAASRRAIPTMDRRAFLRRSGLGVGVGLGDLAAHAGEEGQGRRRAEGRRRRQDRGQAHRLRPLLGRLRGRRGGRERRLGAPGAGVRFADQPRRALRQGRRAARARPRRVPPQVPDEAGRRQVPAHQLGPGAQRDQRQDARAEQGRAAPTRSSSSARPSTTTSSRTCCASG